MKQILIKNQPSELGYYMPAEWEEHSATWLAWPHNKDTWPDKISNVERSYVEMAKALHSYENVNILINDKNSEFKSRKVLISAGINIKKVFFYLIKTVDAWIRDYGPNFIINRKKNLLAMNNWEFNAWGGKYIDLMEDNIISKKINKYLKFQCFMPGIILEGGSIDVNGKGTCLTTEQCLLNKNRNPALSKADIEQYLSSYLGVKNIIWLREGIMGDDTDGHIDDIARFVDPTTILCAFEDNKNDQNYKILKENYEILKSSKDQDGRKIKAVKLPMPRPVKFEDIRLPASYANFYIANKTVLVPIFAQRNDKKAIRILEKLFPHRKIIGINCVDLVSGLGGIHCVTQQQPKI